MTIAELFVNIGVKGDEKAKQAVSGVKDNLKEIGSSSLAAKAALIGVIYGLERLTGMAAARGMELKQFSAATGLSADTLQRWQYAARQFGVEGNEVAGTVKTIQSSMTNMLLGKGAPEGLGLIAQKVGFDRNKARDAFYVMGKLQEFAKVVPPDIAGNILKGFGVSENMFQFMRQNKLDLDKIKPSNLFSQGEIDQLAKVDVAWSNFWNTLKMFSGHQVAKFGLPAVNELAKATKLMESWIKTVEVMIKQFPILADVAKAAFGVITAAVLILGGPIMQISAAITGIIALMGEWEKHKEGAKDSIFGSTKGDKTNGKDSLFGKEFNGNILEKLFTGFIDKVAGPAPLGTPIAAGGNAAGQTVNMTVNNHGVKDAKDGAHHFEKAINQAGRKLQNGRAN